MIIVTTVCDCDVFCDSFLDDAFRKNLESALRFGTPLLVQDVENYDPILNPVLNREVRRTGGRVLITLGDQDIDLSPSFTIFLSTRDPTVSVRIHVLQISFFSGKILYMYTYVCRDFCNRCLFLHHSSTS